VKKGKLHRPTGSSLANKNSMVPSEGPTMKPLQEKFWRKEGATLYQLLLQGVASVIGITKGFANFHNIIAASKSRKNRTS